jgi:hypothetical protein
MCTTEVEWAVRGSRHRDPKCTGAHPASKCICEQKHLFLQPKKTISTAEVEWAARGSRHRDPMCEESQLLCHREETQVEDFSSPAKCNSIHVMIMKSKLRPP